MKRPLRILTNVWGHKTLDWMERGLFQSLKWPKNNAAIQHAIYTVFTMPGEMQRVEELFCQVVPKEQVQVINLVEIAARNKMLPNATNFLLSSFVISMHECLSSGEQLLLAPPDTIFSEGTIPTLLDIGGQADVCVAVPHPRVDPTFLVAMQDQSHGPISGPEMVNLAWESLHKSWSEAAVGRDAVNTYIGGVSWRKLQSGNIAVQHMLPTTYLINFTPDDLTFFTHPHPKTGQPPHFSFIDHEWPGEHLTPKGRQRTIGSSDDAFIVEVTDPESNVPHLRPANPFKPDAFARQLAHNIHNMQNVTIFRPAK